MSGILPKYSPACQWGDLRNFRLVVSQLFNFSTSQAPRKLPRNPATFLQAYTVKHIQKGLTLFTQSFQRLYCKLIPLLCRLAMPPLRLREVLLAIDGVPALLLAVL